MVQFDIDGEGILTAFRSHSLGQVIKSYTPFLDHPAGGFPACGHQGGPCAADANISDIGGLLPIALCGRISL